MEKNGRKSHRQRKSSVKTNGWNYQQTPTIQGRKRGEFLFRNTLKYHEFSSDP
jgi:hypothetical protein